ncbi:MAG TPA: GDP-mannose 4,6-dehydratase [Ghiorsea sp.]|nr:GDP-mannose 4,6-dehydratase [Ghiorsea sp.]
MAKTALIYGVSGQDGALLARLLLEKGCRVVGASRNAEVTSFASLKKLKVQQDVELISASLHDVSAVSKTIHQVKPDEVYHLSGQSSVGLSFAKPAETFQSHAVDGLNLLEALRVSDNEVRLFQAGSGECFGETSVKGANESSAFFPVSPYAVAKVAAFWNVKCYRDTYGLYACTGLLFNHESPLRASTFVTKKIVEAACRITNGSNEILKLGNTSIRRDWGWAEEYVDAMWRMLQQDKADDYVIATGVSHSLETFVSMVFAEVGLNWSEHVVSDSSLFRPTDIVENVGDASKAKRELDWAAKLGLKDIVKKMITAQVCA